MSNQLEATISASQPQDSKPVAESSAKESTPNLHDEILVDIETAKGRLVLKKTVRSGMVAIQYND